MSNQKFSMSLNINGKYYNIPVEITYESEQVQRFTVYGKDRKLLLEKRLNVSGEKWRVVEGSLMSDKSIEEVTYALWRIFQTIDAYMEQKTQNEG